VNRTVVNGLGAVEGAVDRLELGRVEGFYSWLETIYSWLETFCSWLEAVYFSLFYFWKHERAECVRHRAEVFPRGGRNVVD